MSTVTEQKPKKHSYRGSNGKMISLAEAKEKRWANKDGQPTKFYEHELKRREAKKNGDTYTRPRASAPEQFHAGIKSPYDLRRRSGYAEIWKVLAENADTFVSHEELFKVVNERLKTDEKSAKWYEEKYSSQDKVYDTHYNSIVINRAPYNKPIEALKQRVIVDAELGVMLMTDVTEPRQLKKRGRKPKVQVEPAVEGKEVEVKEVINA